MLPTLYDDGGYSRGTMERSALKRLIADYRDSAIDVVVVYKVDRLTRALSDFAKLVEVFDRHGVSFVRATRLIASHRSRSRFPGVRLHEQGLRANNGAENSHQPVRRRERKTRASNQRNLRNASFLFMSRSTTHSMFNGI
jgi:transposase-like protein